MKDHVSVQIKTTRQIKAFLTNNYGQDIVFPRGSICCNHLILVLSKAYMRHEELIADYSEEVKLYISIDTYNRFGCYLNKTQTMYFNMFVDEYMKAKLCCYADSYLRIVENAKLYKAIEYAMDMIKISDEDWQTDSVKRFYHRYRIRNGLPILHDKQKNIEKLLG
jgi:hypothetical protein